MYNGGVSYKGDKQLAQQVMPEALKLANMVRALKTSAGLDNLEKVYDIEGGTVRVVDFAHVRHIYIDVAPIPEDEEAEEDYEELERSTYAIFPVHSDEWSATSAPSTKAAAVTAARGADSTGFLIADQNLLKDNYNYKNTFAERFAWAELAYVGHAGMRIYTRITTAANRYSMSWGDRGDGRIYHRGQTVLDLNGLFSYDHFIGFGIMGDKLIFAWVTPTDFSQEAIPYAAYNLVTVESVDVTHNTDTQSLTASLASRRVVGTFSQDRPDYGIVADGGFGRPQYQINQAGFWYDVPYDPEKSYHPLAGSLWFNFSPDGTKAVRCRYFPQRTVDGSGYTATVTHKTWREELSFSLDGNDDVQMTRTKTANANGAAYSAGTTTTAYDNDTAYKPPLSSLQPDGTIFVQTLSSGSSRTETYTIGSAVLPLAYDYDTEGNPVTLEIQFTSGTGTDIWTEDSSGSRTTTYTDEFVPLPTGAQVYTDVSVSSTSGTRTEARDITIVSQLLYTQGGTTHTIPYYHSSMTENYSGSVTNASTIEHKWSAGFDVTLVSESYTGSGSSSTAGATVDNYVDVYVGAGISDMDLRYGWIIISDCAATSTWTGTGTSSSSPTNGASIPLIGAGSSTYVGERVDTLRVFRDGAATEIDLPQAVGDPTIVYSVSETVASSGSTLRKTGSALFIFDIFGSCGGRATYRSNGVYTGTSFPRKSSCWAEGFVRGSGGSLAIRDNGGAVSGLFSVFGSAFSWDRDNTDTWADFVSEDGGFDRQNIAQINRFPICQQAVYHYDEASGTVSVVTDVLWPAEEFLFDPPYLEKDTGVGLTPFTNLHAYGVVGLVEFVDSDESL